ncbi:hypothetical protein GW17_00034270, partial [Ensete ventricosum]
AEAFGVLSWSTGGVLSDRAHFVPNFRVPSDRIVAVMATWEQLGELSTVAQLTGLVAARLIGLIVQAATTARMHKKNCQRFARHLKLIGNLLEQLKISELKKYPETREPLEQLEDALRRSYILVASYRPVHTGPAADQYADRPLPGGTTKIARRRLISAVGGRLKKKKGKEERRRSTWPLSSPARCPRALVARGLTASRRRPRATIVPARGDETSPHAGRET